MTRSGVVTTLVAAVLAIAMAEVAAVVIAFTTGNLWLTLSPGLVIAAIFHPGSPEDTSMSAPGPSTAQRGLGSQHQQARRRALANMQDGDPCARCGGPMYQWMITWTSGRPTSAYLDLDDFPGRRFGGPQVKLLSHRSCNRKAGSIAGNRSVKRKIKRAAVRARTYGRW